MQMYVLYENFQPLFGHRVGTSPARHANRAELGFLDYEQLFLYHRRQVFDLCLPFQIYYDLIDFPKENIIQKVTSAYSLHYNSCQIKCFWNAHKNVKLTSFFEQTVPIRNALPNDTVTA